VPAKVEVAPSQQIDYIDMINSKPKGELLCGIKRARADLALPAAQFS
jgi:hypothetical protein